MKHFLHHLWKIVVNILNRWNNYRTYDFHQVKYYWVKNTSCSACIARLVIVILFVHINLLYLYITQMDDRLKWICVLKIDTQIIIQDRNHKMHNVSYESCACAHYFQTNWYPVSRLFCKSCVNKFDRVNRPFGKENRCMEFIIQ